MMKVMCDHKQMINRLEIQQLPENPKVKSFKVVNFALRNKKRERVGVENGGMQ